MSRKVAEQLDFVLQRYPMLLLESDYKIIEYMLPSVHKRKKSSFNFLKNPAYENNTLISNECNFIYSDMNDFKSFSLLYDIIINEFQMTDYHYSYDLKTMYYTLYCFTFSFNFIKIFHIYNKNISLNASIKVNTK